MENRWRDADARAAVELWAREGVAEDLALRVYTTRLLGAEPQLVLHGGGNTSVKTRMVDVYGDEVDVLCVKGSGWDMATIAPAGLPAVRLDPLLRLRGLDALSDQAMVSVQRANLLDSAAPNPSVETLLHAFLPAKYVDHTHANAVLALTDQEDGAARAAQALGPRMPVVPYIMPGFALAKAAAAAFEAAPGAEGLVLLKHGIFTVGESARESYDRMIAAVTRAEGAIAEAARARVFASAPLPRKIAPVAKVAPVLRGAVAEPDADEPGRYRRWLLDFRTSPAIRAFVDGADLARYARAGVVTPDHVIRTKPWPLVLPAPEAGALDAFREKTRAAVATYAENYRAYFARHAPRSAEPKTMLDSLPRVALVPGLGLFGMGASARAARIAADLAEAAVAVITDAEAIGRFAPVGEAEMFDVEYWSLEQAKLGRAAEPPLARQVAVITGAAGGIGAATARAFAAEGAAVAVLDRDCEGAQAVAEAIGGAALGIACDVTRPDEVAAAFDRVVEAFGGVDIVVSNAGAAWRGRIGEVDDASLRESFELNFFAHQTVARTAVAIMRAQGTGGVLLFNASKQALDPGPDFGPYGLPKAATLALMRQYAIDYGADGVRSCAVNADRVRTGIYAGGLLEERAKARGMSVSDYLAGGNLLKREVKTDDVARAFVALAKAEKTTAAVLTVDGGNIAAAPR